MLGEKKIRECVLCPCPSLFSQHTAKKKINVYSRLSAHAVEEYKFSPIRQLTAFGGTQKNVG
jgi:hypothetical protein